MKRKTRKTWLGVALITLSLAFTLANAQTNYRQAIVVAGGIYEFSAPYTDYVRVGKYNPQTNTFSFFDTIYTQSTTDVVIDDHFAFVAAPDSLVRYDIDTYERTHAIEVPGINKLAVWNNHLIVTRQWGAFSNYVQVYNKNNLSLVYEVPQVSDEAFSVLVFSDTAYVAVPGGWMSNIGKIAVIDLTNQQFVREINLDTIGHGMRQLFLYGDTIVALNTMGWGAVNSSIVFYNPHTTQWDYVWIDAAMGNGSSYAGAGIVNDSLYAVFNGNIGLFNLRTRQLTDTVLIPFNNTIAAAAINQASQQLWITQTDYFSFGNARIFSLNGDSLNGFDIGISPEAIAFDYRLPVAITEKDNAPTMLVYPNPCNDYIQLPVGYSHCKLWTLNGQLLKEWGRGEERINVGFLPSGLYIVELIYENTVARQKLIKK